MTREQIEEWMRLSGADFPHIASLNRDLFPVFARFAEYVAKHEGDRIADESKHIIKRAEARGAAMERDECAKVCEVERERLLEWGRGLQVITADKLAKAIQTRGEK